MKVPKSVEFIGPGSFHGCQRLKTTTFQGNSILGELGGTAFAQSSLTMIRGLQTMPIQSRTYIALDYYFKPSSKVFLCGNFSGPMDETLISL
jgi:hypothetical protein